MSTKHPFAKTPIATTSANVMKRPGVPVEFPALVFCARALPLRHKEASGKNKRAFLLILGLIIIRTPVALSNHFEPCKLKGPFDAHLNQYRTMLQIPQTVIIC
jgi:hypothetical protein